MFTVLIRYLLPGLLPTLALWIWYLCVGEKLPAIMVFIIIDFLITIPFVFLWMCHLQKLPIRLRTLTQLLPPQQCVDLRRSVGVIIVSLLWAVGSFMLMRPVSVYLQVHLFGWIPHWFDLSQYLSAYNDQLRRITWWMLIPASILIPIAEEYYFRGFLLQRSNWSGFKAPVMNALLFSIYHIWSLWLVPVRFIAMMPVTVFVWKYRNVYLSMIVHVLLNVVGDVVLIYPLVF